MKMRRKILTAGIDHPLKMGKELGVVQFEGFFSRTQERMEGGGQWTPLTAKGLETINRHPLGGPGYDLSCGKLALPSSQSDEAKAVDPLHCGSGE